MDETAPTLLRALDEREIRLNCIALACHATTYMRGRMTDPITVAQEFFDWVTKGERPAPSRVEFGTQPPAPVTAGFGSGEGASNAEAERANQQYTGGADLIELGPTTTRPTRRPS